MLGYRAPKQDSSSASKKGDGRLDVYLADVGDSVYGYCTTDDPHALRSSGYAFSDLSAFCVLDNDFGVAQFPGTHGLAALEVTAAHEFFHAVQFAYDAWEDTWLMEGSAAWIEDEVYDDVNDNRQFLTASPLTRPGVPLDASLPPFHYGAWIFWRFLSERYGTGIVSDVWTLADGAAGGPDRYSLQAATEAVGARGARFRSAFAAFAVANRLAARSYEEGRAYPAPRAAASWRLARGAGARTWSARLDHLTSTALAFRPGSAGGVLRLQLDLPDGATGSAAQLVVVSNAGRTSVRTVALGPTGAVRVSIPFAAGKVVVLVLANAGTRISDCWSSPTPFSCSGIPRDDRRVYRVRASVS